MDITTIGIDLAKNVFQVHGTDKSGKAVLKKQLRRSQVLAFFANTHACLIAMEACGSAHYWARKFLAMGHRVKLIAPQYVKPFVRRNKNDAADAAAICEAASRPDMPSVPIKTEEQQAVLSIHRARQGLVKARTAQANQIRGLLAEFGITINKGIYNINRDLPDVIESGEIELPMIFRKLLQQLLEHYRHLDTQVAELEQQIKQWHKHDERSQALEKIKGVGVLTASAMIATIGDGKNFRNGRQLTAWLGMVPRQHSTGGKQVLLGISKRGDSYLRTLLIHGARSAIDAAIRKKEMSPWLEKLLMRKNKNVVAVALANKNARVMWAMLSKGSAYEAGYRWSQS